MLPSGWFLVIQGRHEFKNDEVRQLSLGGEVIACFVEEHVMGSRAAGWRDGRQVWSVTQGRHEFKNDEVRQLSLGGEVIACFVEEHVMVSRAAGWRDGRQVWSVTH